MSKNTLHPRWILLAAAVFIVLSACKLAGPGGITIQVGATDTPVPTNTPPPTPTATATIAPTFTPAPSPTFTEPAPPTNPPAAPPTSGPAQPTQGPENQSGMATVRITNSLGVSIKVTLNGPEQRSFTIRGQGVMEVELAAGTYNFEIVATGYYPVTGTRSFVPGENTWQIVK